MGNFDDAVRQLQLRLRDTMRNGLQCPDCNAANVPGAPDWVVIDTTGTSGCCDNCGYYGPIDMFQSPLSDRDRRKAQ